MNTKEQLQIILITYNRSRYLRRTLERILSDQSPIRDYDITIFDNHSTDDTCEIINAFKDNHPNLKHLRHHVNIGGNANIARALESRSKDYLWILCDDDDYDWTSWSLLESAIARGDELICVSTFNLKNDNKEDFRYLVNQMTFLPANIYSKKLLSEAAIRNIHDNIATMFPQLVPVIMHINNGGRITTLPIGLVHTDPDRADNTFTRGYRPEQIFTRGRTMILPVGFANAVFNFTSIKDARSCFYVHIAGDYPDSLGWLIFYREIFLHLNGHENDCHFDDLCRVLAWHRRLTLRLIHFIQNTPLHRFLVKSQLYTMLKRHAAR